MQITPVNPWTWQDHLGFSQAIEVSNPTGTLYCAGQAGIDADGRPVEGSMTDQLKLALANVKAVIEKAGYTVSNIVRLNIYTTSIEEYYAAAGEYAIWLQTNNCRPASILLEVKGLAFPETMIELEATAVR